MLALRLAVLGFFFFFTVVRDFYENCTYVYFHLRRKSSAILAMKGPNCGRVGRVGKKSTARRRRRPQQNNEDAVSEMLKLCLEKVIQLQSEMEEQEDEQDAEAAGYAACALETIRFLSEQGLPPDHPMVLTLSEKLQQ